MSAVVMLGNSKRVSAYKAVQSAVNERARELGVSEARRLAAIGTAFNLLKFGHSPAWSVSEACRDLRGVSPSSHHGYPTPPAAA